MRTAIDHRMKDVLVSLNPSTSSHLAKDVNKKVALSLVELHLAKNSI